jgi:ADP-ribose pyrophosphatase
MAFEVVGSRVVYDGTLARVRMDRVAMPGGEVAEREIVEHPEAVAVVALDDDGSVLLVRQYRSALGRHELELPAGLRDVDGEDALATAQRELAEEVATAAAHWEVLVRFANSGGWTDETTTVYLATGLRQVAVPDGFSAQGEEADMEVVRLPLAEAAARAAAGELTTDAKTLLGLLLADRRRDAARPDRPPA